MRPYHTRASTRLCSGVASYWHQSDVQLWRGLECWEALQHDRCRKFGAGYARVDATSPQLPPHPAKDSLRHTGCKSVAVPESLSTRRGLFWEPGVDTNSRSVNRMPPHPARTHWPLEATKGYWDGSGTFGRTLSDCRGFGHGGLDGHPGLRPRHIGSNGTLGAGIRRNVLRHFSPSDRRFLLIRRLHGFLATITLWCGFRRGDAPAHDREAPQIGRHPHQKRVHCQVPHISRATIA